MMEKFETVHRRRPLKFRTAPVRLTGWVQLTFRFMAREERDLYLLAARLKQDGYRMKTEVRGSGSVEACLATGWIHVEEAELNQACLEMLSLADRYRVIFDRWDQTDERFCL